MPNQVLKLDSRDNVLIALTDLQRGAQIPFDAQTFILESDVPAKHKFTAEDLRRHCGESGRTDPARRPSYNQEYPSSSCGIPRENRRIPLDPAGHFQMAAAILSRVPAN